MMLFKNTLKTLTYLFIASSLLISCDDETAEDQLSDGQAVSNDYHLTQTEIDQSIVYVDQAMLNAGQGGRVSQTEEDSYCAAFSHDKDSKTITLDFGTDGCIGQDGKTRQGIISISYAGILDPLGSNQRTITFNNFSVDGNVLNGTLISTRWELVPGSTNLKSTATATGMSLKLASDGSTITLNGSWERTIALTVDNFINSTYSITGSSAGSTREGRNYTTNITTPITYQLSCLESGYPYPIEGVQRIVVVDAIPLNITIDYGAGNCDKEVLIDVNGQSTTYTLP